MRVAITLASLGALALVGACSFLTDFPDVETAPAGGNGGSGGAGSTATSTSDTSSSGLGGEGGGPPCTECRNCFPDGAVCPDVTTTDSYVLVAPPIMPDPMARIAWATDGAQLSGFDYVFIGTYSSELSTPTGTITSTGTQQGGFVLRGGPSPFSFGTAVCTDGGLPADDEVFMNGVALAPGGTSLVIGGAFQGDRMALYPSTIDCSGATGQVNSPTPGDSNLVPFLVWAAAGTGSVLKSLEPGAELDNNNGYISDVAGLPNATDPDHVVAIGLANGNPFDGSTADIPGFGYYLVSSNGVANPFYLDPTSVECTERFDAFSLPGLRSAVAADTDGFVWAAGSGCLGDERSFLVRVPVMPDGSFGTPVEAIYGRPGHPMSISKVAVSTPHVVVAGTYSGEPEESWLGTVSGFEPGDDGDAFVMAFDRVPWTNQLAPKWFRRIRSQGDHPDGLDDATVDALVVDSDRVSITGRIGEEGGIGAAYGCFTSPPLQRGRAYLAQLDEATGGVGWLRIDGFDLAPGDDHFARGTALVPLSGAIVTATSTHGEMLLECDGSSVGVNDAPLAHIRHYFY